MTADYRPWTTSIDCRGFRAVTCHSPIHQQNGFVACFIVIARANSIGLLATTAYHPIHHSCSLTLQWSFWISVGAVLLTTSASEMMSGSWASKLWWSQMRLNHLMHVRNAKLMGSGYKMKGPNGLVIFFFKSYLTNRSVINTNQIQS